LILAGRNAHKTFLTASALVGFDVKWIYPTDDESYLACNVSASDIEREILSLAEKPTAVYLTSPDYLGNILDIKSISEVCRKYGVLLLVDNAHGGYLKFLSPSLHPMDLGADMCCDSAHKTLPTLTGGGYLHISEGFAEKNLLCCNASDSEKRSYISRIVKEGMSIFASTSPSYLILHSLDLTNKYLTKLPELLSLYIPKVEQFKKYLLEKGFSLVGKEPLKVTVSGKKFGYSGVMLGKLLEKNNIFPEFYDDDFLVLMFTPQTDCFDELKNIFGSLSLNSVECGVDNSDSGEYKHPQRAMTPREALLSKKELIDVRNAKGRILASPSVGCPPAVPIAVCGELIDEETVNRFLKYGVEAVFVVCK
jgi:arginine/lysine/ornithine decarboxylase